MCYTSPLLKLNITLIRIISSNFLKKMQALSNKFHSYPIKSWKKEKCPVARRGGCRRVRRGCANEPQGIFLRTLTRNCERMSRQRALRCERMRAFFARMNAGAYKGKGNCRITKEFDCTKGKSEGEKKVKCVWGSLLKVAQNRRKKYF